jgi:hypothetical protein
VGWLQTFWHWYVTVEQNPQSYWLQDRTGALAAIAGVAVVIWTGGLIAYQLKKFALPRTYGLDIVQTGFMFALVATFMHPLSFRIAVTAFFLLYTAQSVVSLRRYRDLSWVDDKQKKLFPNRTQEQWASISDATRKYAWFTLLTMLLYVWAIIWPYQVALTWISTICTFLGYQTIIYYFNTTEANNEFQKAEIQILADINKGVSVNSAAAVSMGKGLAALVNELRNRK